jgi:predicted dehydrogenase
VGGVSSVRFATIDGERPLRGVVVGAGFLGPFWVRELLASGDTELAGWVDVDPVRLARRTAELKLDGLARGSDLDAMLAAERPDFVVNVTAPEAHRDVTLTALAHGAAVLSEKPLATSMDAAREMVAAADAAQRLLMVSQNRRYMPTLIAYRDAVAGLGTLASLTCDFYIAHRAHADGFVRKIEEPLLLDMAIHLFDAARFITRAEPVSVYCESYSPPWDWFAGPSAANAIFRMTGDVRLAFNGSWCADGFQTSWTGRWRAVGEHGSATWDGEGTPRVEPGPGVDLPRVASVRRPRPVRDRFEGLVGALAEFVTALRTGRVPQSEAHDNLRSLGMCHAAVESARSQAPVTVAARVPWP